jgi:hypothetical protein
MEGEGVNKPKGMCLDNQIQLQGGHALGVGNMCLSPGLNLSPIYMSAYVVCPNLEAAAVLSKRRKTVTLNIMKVPNVLVQSEFETVRNARTHSAITGL